MTSKASVAICHGSRLLREGISQILKAEHYRIVASGAGSDCFADIPLNGKSLIVFLMGEQSGGGPEPDSIAALKQRYTGCRVLLLLDRCSAQEFLLAQSLGVDGILLKSISREGLLRSLEFVMMDELDVVLLGQMFKSSTTASTSVEMSLHRLGHDQAPADELVSPTEDVVPDEEDVVPNEEVEEEVVDETGSIGGDSEPEDPAEERHEASGMNLRLLQRAKLSERELEVMSFLVSGYSNKLIARECSITEATVKVHLKSILRKIHVENRTQAAVWALNHLSCSEDAGVPARHTQPGSNGKVLVAS